jgi:hypothetical protein
MLLKNKIVINQEKILMLINLALFFILYINDYIYTSITPFGLACYHVIRIINLTINKEKLNDKYKNSRTTEA